MTKLNAVVAESSAHCATAFLALGSNLGNSAQLLSQAVAAIARLPATTLIARSSLYRSPAWGASSPQPDYLNAVVSISTTLAPLALLQHAAKIEAAHGRQRNGEKNSARTLDIDLLLYDDVQMESETLTLPHPRMHERDFVLQPLLEIAPEATIVGRGSVHALLGALPATHLTRLGDSSEWI